MSAKPVPTLGELPTPPPHHRFLAEVLEAAGNRCQCTGCGETKAHGIGGTGRCLHTVSGTQVDDASGELVGYVGTGRDDEQIVIAPADPALSVHAAARLPASELRAWCLRCLQVVERSAQRERRRHRAAELAEAQGELFGTEGLQ